MKLGGIPVNDIKKIPEYEHFEEKFKEINAEEAFSDLTLQNVQDTSKIINGYEGDKEKLRHLIKAYKKRYQEHQTREDRDPKPYQNYTNNEGKFRAELLGRDIEEDYDFVTLQDSGQIMVFQDGWWKPYGKTIIEEEATQRLGQEFMKNRLSGVVKYIQTNNFVKRENFQPPKRMVNVQNGVYNLEEDALEEHNPEHNFTFRIDYPYIKDAECPEIDDFLSEVTGSEEDKETLYEIIAYSLLPSNPLNKAAMLAGSGDNGKTVFLEIVKELLGQENVVNKKIQDLQRAFDAHSLYGKLAMIDDDLPPTKIKDPSMFKKLTGGSDIGAEVKFGDHYDFQPFAFPMFAANQIPPSEDESHGFFRRWVIVDFPYQFKNNPNPEDEWQKQAEPREELVERLTSPSEMEGLLRKSIEKLEEILEQNEFSHTRNVEDVRKKWREHSIPVVSFIERFVQQGRTKTDDRHKKEHMDTPDWDSWSFDYIRKDDFQKMVSAYAKRRGGTKPSKKQITEMLKDSDLNAGSTKTRQEPDELVESSTGQVPVYSGVKMVLDPESDPKYLLDLYTGGSNQSIIVKDESDMSLEEEVRDWLHSNVSQEPLMYTEILEQLDSDGLIDRDEDEDRVLELLDDMCEKGEGFEPVSGEFQIL